MIVYPNENYVSWISEDDADQYFETRLNAGTWDNANKEAALMTAFRSINELNLNVDPTETDQLTALKQAQCEQALHELKSDIDGQAISGLTLGGLLSVKMPADQTSPDRYSKRAISILRPYMVVGTVTRTR
ncbi:MAG TPA: hypothetical protein ENI27_05400 [bacterium]|nr:hypothetical protein [bacterium]